MGLEEIGLLPQRPFNAMRFLATFSSQVKEKRKEEKRKERKRREKKGKEKKREKKAYSLNYYNRLASQGQIA